MIVTSVVLAAILGARANRPIRAIANFTGIPDKELGDLGEKHIYERELALASRLGQPASQVKWVSRGNPQSPFDIRSIRELGGAIRDHYIEVKSTTVLDDTHIFVSAREIAFLDEHNDHCSVVLVRFHPDKSLRDIRDFTIDQLRDASTSFPSRSNCARSHSALLEFALSAFRDGRNERGPSSHQRPSLLAQLVTLICAVRLIVERMGDNVNLRCPGDECPLDV